MAAALCSLSPGIWPKRKKVTPRATSGQKQAIGIIREYDGLTLRCSTSRAWAQSKSFFEMGFSRNPLIHSAGDLASLGLRPFLVVFHLLGLREDLE